MPSVLLCDRLAAETVPSLSISLCLCHRFHSLGAAVSGFPVSARMVDNEVGALRPVKFRHGASLLTCLTLAGFLDVPSQLAVRATERMACTAHGESQLQVSVSPSLL